MAQNSIKPICELLVIGGSAGSLEVLLKVVAQLEPPTSFAIVVVLHRKASTDELLVNLLGGRTSWPVQEADEKEPILPGHIYIAPADYHLLIEQDHTFSLDASEKINYSRPGIDATFESAAEAYGSRLVGLLLSGANSDGAEGMVKIKEQGGVCIVQEPATAVVDYMPRQAIELVEVDAVLDIEAMIDYINRLS